MKKLVKISAVLALSTLLVACGAPRDREPCGIDQTGQPGNCDRTLDTAAFIVAG